MRHLLLALLLVSLTGSALARGHSYSSHSSHARSYHSHSYSTHARSSSSRSTHVHGYYRKDGTYVRGYDRHPHSTSSTTTRTHRGTHSSTTYAPGARDRHGRLRRSAAAKDAFKHQHPCPSTGRSSGACPGYVIDHIDPLACGGADAPSNMQWQTTADAKAKDKTERIGCH